MACPYIHLCEKPFCIKEQMCQNPTYWSRFWRKKVEREELEKGITKAERRKQRKSEKKIKGRKTVAREEREAAHKEIYAEVPLCTRKGEWCDKWAACSVLNECVVQIPRIVANPILLEALRGPRTVKSILRLLSKHDPEPMKSYYQKK